jgi:hypothetical protein
MKKQFIPALLMIWTLSLAAQTRGQEYVYESGEPFITYSDSHALIIGESDYTNGWPSLSGVKRDVPAVQKLFEELGFSVETLVNANSRDLKNGISAFLDKYGYEKDARLLIYYAGHGQTLDLDANRTMGYIVPVDAPPPARNRTGFQQSAIPMQQFDAWARQTSCLHLLFLFDSCFSGSVFMLRGSEAPDYINAKTAEPVRQFITAGREDESVPDESIFRKQLEVALRDSAADTDHDGYVSGTELGEFLERTVITFSGNTQHPQSGKIRDPDLSKGDFVFKVARTAPVARVPAPTAPPSRTDYSPLTDFDLGLNENGVVITKYKGSAAVVNIPAVVDGTPVTEIGESAFRYSGLTSVTIPNSVTSIGYGAFSACSGLTSVTIPNSVTEIGDWVFVGCSSLTSVTIPNSVTEIGDWVFVGCSSLTSIAVNEMNEKYKSLNGILFSKDGTTILRYPPAKVYTSYIIPNSVTEIGDSAFESCSSLTSVTIPNSVTVIGEQAFYGCSGLTSVTIPNSVTVIGEQAFCGCSSLTYITIPNSVIKIWLNAFSGCSSLTSVTIPNSITQIYWYTFSGCSSLTSVTVPNSVTEIMDGAFSGCSSLTSVTIPNSVTQIGYDVFSGCSSLTSITIPDSVTKIEYGVFSGCSSLTSVTVPNSVTFIGHGAFSGCSSLASVTIPNSVDFIGWEAFSGCSSLTSVTIPNSVDFIGYGAFSGCTGLSASAREAIENRFGDDVFEASQQ